MMPKRIFHPLLFQSSLAAGGVSLMAFNFLQFSTPHGKGLITLSNVMGSSMTGLQMALYYPLVLVMLGFTLLHFFLTAVFLKDFFIWAFKEKAFAAFLENPYGNVTIFAIISSLGMTANVFWAPAGFFTGLISDHLQGWMLPSLAFFGVLWAALVYLEFKTAKTWFLSTVDKSRFNFVWLLDAFAFGLVSLAGTGIAAMAADSRIAAVAAAMSVVVLGIGIPLFLVKLVFLIRLQLTKRTMPDAAIQPAFFLLVPIMCLFALSFYRVGNYLHAYLAIDVSGASYVVMSLSYVAVMVWGLYCIYFISDYFRNHFRQSSFSPPQWGMV
jgi:hypothetical protein